MPKLKIIIFGLLVISLCFSQSKGGYWSFSGNGNDSAIWDGINNSGTLVSTALYSSDNGINGSYLNLETVGSNDYLLINDETELDFNKENIGISFWIYPTVLNDVHFIISKGDQYISPKTTNYAVRISKSKNIEFLIRDQNDQAQKIASTFTVSEGAWQFIAVYYDYNNSIVKFWNSNNSVPFNSVGFTTEPIMNDDPLAIGSWYKSNPPNSSTKDFEGWIDEVKISGREEDLFSLSLDVNSENNANQELTFNLYPNPISKTNSTKNISIEFNSTARNQNVIKIYSLLGREVYSNTFTSSSTLQQFDLQLSNLNTGLYFVSLINHYGTQTKKLLILK